jgi:cold shock CspA family protein
MMSRENMMKGAITTLIRKQEGRLRADGSPDFGGYGFIRDEEDHDRFFHARDLCRDQKTRFEELSEGMKVEFEPTSGNRSRLGGGNGLRAENVRIV